jgi:glycosyltransferase involved in cell wall biosynthesis
VTDVLIVSLGSTVGLREADDQLAASLERAGAEVAVVRAAPPRSVRTLMLTDYLWARAARAAAREGIARTTPRAIVYSTSTAALLWPRPGAIRFDSLAASNRPGRHGLWQRPLESRRLAAASLLLPWSESSLGALRPRAPVAVVGIAVEPSGPTEPPASRGLAAITYAAHAHKKGLDRVLDAWQRARRPDEQLVVAGAPRVRSAEGVRSVGLLARAEYRALLRRSRLFVTAPRREDYGIAQLEALADGCALVTTPAPGPYEALAIARTLDDRLVSDDLAGAIRLALDAPRPDYAQRAAQAIGAFSGARIDAAVAALTPKLIAGA